MKNETESFMKLGIDVGGTKIEILALDDHGKELLRRRIPTPRGAYQPIIDSICRLVEEVELECGSKATVGLGIPGTITPRTGLVKNANTTELIGHSLQKDLEKILDRSIAVANDANCFALSEAWDGAGADATTVFGIILGTGCGGGIVHRKQLLVGINSIGGEWGHNRLPDPLAEDLPSPPCYCGHRGCLETYISGSGLARDFAQFTGRPLTAQQIVELASEGDAEADAALVRLEHRLARSLAVVINILDPDLIVVGGGLSNCERIYTNVPKIWGAYIFSPEVETRMVRAKFGDSSGVRGAAHLNSAL